MLVTQAELAREVNRNPSTVLRTIRRHSIPVVDGRVDREVFLAVWNARVDRLQQQRALAKQRQSQEPSGVLGPTLEESRRRREAAEAERAEILLRKEAGELLERAPLSRELGKRISEVKRQFDALPERAAAALGTSDDHRRKVRQFLRDELAEIMRAVADMGIAESSGAG